jgi:hypothetical protein
MKKLLTFFLGGLLTLGLLSCNRGDGSFFSPDLSTASSYEEPETENIPPRVFKNKYLCVTLPTGGDSEIVKVLDLQTKELTSLPVPGTVQGMSSDLENDIIYVNAKSSQGTDYSLYKLDVKAKQISRILAFSQLGIKPTHFIIDKNIVYVTGKRAGIGTFYGNDLINHEWFAVANNISTGRIEYGFTEDTFHVIAIDDEYITKTVVDVKLKQILSRKTINHSIPFGNNVFIPSPHGLYVYVLHQLQDSFIPFAYNIKQGTENRFDEVQTNGGLLYSAIVSNDGKHLFTNVNREIYHYKLEGDKLISLPKIVLKIPESRNMAMAADCRTIYITHESGSYLSVVTISNDSEYTVSQMYIGGNSNQVFLF